jgi:hypothetical protein
MNPQSRQRQPKEEEEDGGRRRRRGRRRFLGDGIDGSLIDGRWAAAAAAAKIQEIERERDR